MYKYSTTYTSVTIRVLYSHDARIILSGAYGTGKTILLREKCGELARKYPKKQFLYVITLTQLMEETDTLLYHDLTNYFKEKCIENVSVIKVS